MTERLELYALPGIPLVGEGDDLCQLICTAVARLGMTLRDDDLLVVAQKIVSKSEGRLCPLGDVEPSGEALDWARKTGKDPRLVQLILDESIAVLRHRPGVMIVEHRLGYVHANAGIDASNVEGEDQVLLLPEVPDASAARLHRELRERCACHVNVLINDSAGRAWRNGIVGFTLGSAGFEVLCSRVGSPDLYGRAMEITEIAVADELAAAASHLMGQAAEAVPAVLVRGAGLQRGSGGAGALIRPREQDLFR